MATVYSDPVRDMLNRTRNRGYAVVDLLVQSISICIGLWLLDEKSVSDMLTTSISKDNFEDMVYERLIDSDVKAARAFKEFSQVRLLKDMFQELLYYWVQFCGDKEKLSRFIERLIYPNLSRYYRADLMVPGWLERLAIELLPDTGGLFYDGTAGAGGVAIKLAKYYQDKKSDVQIVTSEVDPLLYNLSVLRAKIHGFTFQQSNEDCIRAYQPFHEGEADMSVMFPPLGGGEPIYISESLTCGSDWSYAFHQLRSLKEGGVGVCRISNGALFNAKNKDFREYLLSLNVLDSVISLPKNSTYFSKAPATSLIVFRKGRKRDEAVHMMELPSPAQLGERRGLDYNLRKSILPVIQENSISANVWELDPLNLSTQKYSSYAHRSGLDYKSMPYSDINQNADDSPDGAVILSDVAQVYRGINFAGVSRDENGTKILRLADVQNGRICKDNITCYDLSKRENIQRYKIQPGDVLISCKGQAIKLCIVTEDIPVLFSHDFLVIRCDRTKLSPQYLFYYFQSPIGQTAVQQIQMGSSIPMIRATDLERLPLHYIPLALQTKYSEELLSENIRLDQQFASLNEQRQRAYKEFYRKVGLEDTV